MITKRKYPVGTISKIVSARMPVPLIKKIDKLCSETGRSKSDIINHILEDYFNKKGDNL